MAILFYSSLSADGYRADYWFAWEYVATLEKHESWKVTMDSGRDSRESIFYF